MIIHLELTAIFKIKALKSLSDFILAFISTFRYNLLSIFPSLVDGLLTFGFAGITICYRIPINITKISINYTELRVYSNKREEEN